MGWSVTGSVLGSKVWVGSRVGRISAWSGPVVQWGRGSGVEGRVHVGQRAWCVAGRHFAIEGREAGVVAVGRDTKTVGRGVGGNVGGLESLGEDLERSLEPLGLVGWECHHLRSTEPNLVQQIVGEVFRLQFDIFKVVENFLGQFLLLFVG